jgi:hypothetical protein
VTEFIGENRHTLAAETVVREKNHADFEDRVGQHQQAINAVDQCLNLL